MSGQGGGILAQIVDMAHIFVGLTGNAESIRDEIGIGHCSDFETILHTKGFQVIREGLFILAHST